MKIKWRGSVEVALEGEEALGSDAGAVGFCFSHDRRIACAM